jgi:ElaB/YqjD/DUF883 family membrane-anchored ribosome-binding protein
MSELETTTEATPTVSELQSQVQGLQESLDYARERVTELRDRNDEHIRNWRDRLHNAERRSSRRLVFLTKALNDAYGEADKFDHTHPDVQRLILGALRVAKLRGMLSDGNDIADALESSEVWAGVKADDRFDATGMASDVIRDRIREEVVDTLEDVHSHPRDPRFSEVWERATKLAVDNSLCSEYDSIAEMFDIPTDQEFDYEGTVDVEFNGTASIAVSGRATRQQIADGDIAYGNIDTSDVLENADYYGTDFSVIETNITVS